MATVRYQRQGEDGGGSLDLGGNTAETVTTIPLYIGLLQRGAYQSAAAPVGPG
jgi:hypothetical protein